jgi:hypothetical protein
MPGPSTVPKSQTYKCQAHQLYPYHRHTNAGPVNFTYITDTQMPGLSTLPTSQTHKCQAHQLYLHHRHTNAGPINCTYTTDTQMPDSSTVTTSQTHKCQAHQLCLHHRHTNARPINSTCGQQGAQLPQRSSNCSSSTARLGYLNLDARVCCYKRACMCTPMLACVAYACVCQ